MATLNIVGDDQKLLDDARIICREQFPEFKGKLAKNHPANMKALQEFVDNHKKESK